MIFVETKDFYEKAASCHRITRQEEIECAKKLKTGDISAREQLVNSYLPVVAAHIKHMKPHMQSLGLVLYCVNGLERAADSFDFLQESETFEHRLNWYLKEMTARYIARRI